MKRISASLSFFVLGCAFFLMGKAASADVIIDRSTDVRSIPEISGGSGRASDPFRIQGITVSGVLEISNRPEYFRIQNVDITSCAGACLVLRNTENVVVRDVDIQSTGRTAIDVSHANGLVMENIQVNSTSDTGITPIKLSYSNGIRIKNFTCHERGTGPSVLDLNELEDASLERIFVYVHTSDVWNPVEISDCHRLAWRYGHVFHYSTGNFKLIDLHSSSDIELRNLWVWGSDGTGINVYNNDRVTISSTAVYNTETGIRINRARTLTLEDCVLQNHRLSAVAAGQYTTNMTLENCVLLDSGVGLRLSYVKGAEILENDFEGNETGLVILGEQERLATDNRVFLNTFRNNDRGVLLDEHTEDNVLFKNDFIDNGGSECPECHAADEGDNSWNDISSTDCPAGNYWSGYCQRMGVYDMCGTDYETCVAGFRQWTFFVWYTAAPNGRDLYPSFNPWKN